MAFEDQPRYRTQVIPRSVPDKSRFAIEPANYNNVLSALSSGLDFSLAKEKKEKDDAFKLKQQAALNELTSQMYKNPEMVSESQRTGDWSWAAHIDQEILNWNGWPLASQEVIGKGLAMHARGALEEHINSLEPGNDGMASTDEWLKDQTKGMLPTQTAAYWGTLDPYRRKLLKERTLFNADVEFTNTLREASANFGTQVSGGHVTNLADFNVAVDELAKMHAASIGYSKAFAKAQEVMVSELLRLAYSGDANEIAIAERILAEENEAGDTLQKLYRELDIKHQQAAKGRGFSNPITERFTANYYRELHEGTYRINNFLIAGDVDAAKEEWVALGPRLLEHSNWKLDPDEPYQRLGAEIAKAKFAANKAAAASGNPHHPGTTASSQFVLKRLGDAETPDAIKFWTVDMSAPPDNVESRNARQRVAKVILDSNGEAPASFKRQLNAMLLGSNPDNIRNAADIISYVKEGMKVWDAESVPLIDSPMARGIIDLMKHVPIEKIIENRDTFIPRLSEQPNDHYAGYLPGLIAEGNFGDTDKSSGRLGPRVYGTTWNMLAEEEAQAGGAKGKEHVETLAQGQVEGGWFSPQNWNLLSPDLQRRWKDAIDAAAFVHVSRYGSRIGEDEMDMITREALKYLQGHTSVSMNADGSKRLGVRRSPAVVTGPDGRQRVAEAWSSHSLDKLRKFWSDRGLGDFGIRQDNMTGGDGSAAITWVTAGGEDRPLILKPGEGLPPELAAVGGMLAPLVRFGHLETGDDDDVWVGDEEWYEMHTPETLGGRKFVLLKPGAYAVWTTDGGSPGWHVRAYNPGTSNELIGKYAEKFMLGEIATDVKGFNATAEVNAQVAQHVLDAETREEARRRILLSPQITTLPEGGFKERVIAEQMRAWELTRGLERRQRPPSTGIVDSFIEGFSNLLFGGEREPIGPTQPDEYEPVFDVERVREWFDKDGVRDDKTERFLDMFNPEEDEEEVEVDPQAVLDALKEVGQVASAAEASAEIALRDAIKKEGGKMPAGLIAVLNHMFPGAQAKVQAALERDMSASLDSTIDGWVQDGVVSARAASRASFMPVSSRATATIQEGRKGAEVFDFVRGGQRRTPVMMKVIDRVKAEEGWAGDRVFKEIEKTAGKQMNIGYGYMIVTQDGKEPPRVREELAAIGLDYDKVVAGEQRITKEQAEALVAFKIQELAIFFAKHFPNVPFSDNQIVALMSMAYTSRWETKPGGYPGPTIIGPKITQAIRNGDWEAAAWEIRHNSAGGVSDDIRRGIMRRRDREASVFEGARVAI